jgi:hypothetical protein
VHSACFAVLADLLNMGFIGLIDFKNCVIEYSMYWSEYMKKFAQVYTERVGDALRMRCSFGVFLKYGFHRLDRFQKLCYR